MIRVLIQIRSPVTRAGLEAIFSTQAEIEVVGSAAEADVVIREETPELADGAASPPVVLLADDAPGLDALRSGVRAALPPDAPATQIIAAVIAASAGLAVVPVEDSSAFFPSARAEQPAEPLTPREMDVIEMLAEGLSNKLIAHRLLISEHTAKFHVNSILAKLHAGTRTEAVMRGIRLGLVKI